MSFEAIAIELVQHGVFQRVAQAPAQRIARYQVSLIGLQLEDAIHRLAPQQPHAARLAAVGYDRLDRTHAVGTAMAVAATELGAPPQRRAGDLRRDVRVEERAVGDGVAIPR